MKLSNIICAALLLGSSAIAADSLDFQHLSREQSMVRLEGFPKYLILPIQHRAPLVDIELIVDNEVIGQKLNIPLARDKVDMYVPVDLSDFKGKSLLVNFLGMPNNQANCWDNIKLADSYTPDLSEPFRPLYHFAPQIGWMNDPNGMFYKDGTYHLYFQYNPYGTDWGNMSWGHASTKDFINWKHEGVPIVPDALGAIFSGSCIVDHKNAAGYGKGAVIAFYTSADERNQTQSIAYSLDNGKTFTKYEKNPVLTKDAPDFRDPKVFYHEASQKYIMVLALGNHHHMEFYSSPNLKDWTLESSFGGVACQDGAWECPDLFPLTAPDGSQKWVLLVNIGNGHPHGGSGTQYFIGQFDGKTFTCDGDPNNTKWQDWGQDHYATVTWDNAPDKRRVAIAWMSNWSYAGMPPTEKFRSSNTIPRDLYLFEHDGQNYLGSRPSPELKKARKASDVITPASEVNFTLVPKADSTTFTLENAEGEHVTYTVNFKDKTFSLNRYEAGKTHFIHSTAGDKVSPIMGEGFDFQIFFDKCSIECFINDGKTVISHLVFPTSPFNKLKFDEATVEVKNTTIYSLK